MTFKSAYTQLTLYYVLIVMIISVCFSILLYQISSNEIDQGLGQQTNILRNLPPFGDIKNQVIPNFEQIHANQLQESNNRLKTNLIYFNLLIFIFSTIASYFLAKRTLEPIEKSVEKQYRFTADASHELRTPLTAIRSEIEVNLRDKNLTLKNSKKLLRSNLEEIQKLEELSGALLMLARFDAEANKNFEKISLEDIIIEAYEKVEKLADNKSIKFINKFSDVSIMGDHQSLTQLFVILIDNAIKYSPKKSKINIELIHNKHHATVKIKDRGCGIDSEDIPYIFDRFYRADASRCKVKTDGYGLGLSIAKEIVQMHNGKISVESKQNQGSEFIIKLPSSSN